MLLYTPRHESLTGSDLTGNNGDANRTYTLAYDNPISARMIVMRAEAILQQGVGFSVNTTTGVVTFLTEVWDDQVITVDYLTTSDTNLYCDTLSVVRFAGLGLAVELESLGTGDGTTTSYDVTNHNIVDESYTLYYGTSDSNDLYELTESTDYYIYKDDGRVLFTAVGLEKVNGKAIYISYMHSPKHSDTILTLYVEQASREVERLTNNYWGTTATAYQYFDGYDSGYPQTDEPFGNQIEPYPEFSLKHKGVLTITSVLFLDKQGDTDTTLDSDDYRIITDDTTQESRLLINRTIPNGKANIKVTYTHGYTSVPALVQELTALLAGIRALINISGGSYSAISTYQLGKKSFSIGQQYVNIESSIKQLQARAQVLLDQYGFDYGCV